MTISKETELGTISVSNVLFAQIIIESFKQEACRGRVWPATKKGRLLSSGAKVNISEFASCIEVEAGSERDRLDLEFPVVVKFGTSIRSLTDAIADYVAESLQEKTGKKPSQIKIKIAGVKSRQVARRNLEVIRRYETC